MREAIAGFPDDMPVLSPYDTNEVLAVGAELDADCAVEVVFINDGNVIVGTDAEDYEPKPGERKSLVVW